MKEIIEVAVKEPMYAMIENVTFAQVPYWFPFCNYRDLKMDIIRPFGPAEKRPLLVWVCGGGFLTMEKGAYIPYLTYYVERGYVVASVEYRLSNSARYPSNLEDVKAAIRYLRAHAEVYGIDPRYVGIMGESAGGYLAAMAGATGREPRFDVGENLGESSAVQAVVDFYGPSGINRGDGLDGAAEQLVPKGTPVTDAEREAVTFMDENTPPYYLLHGTKDPFIPVVLSEKFYEQMEVCGVPCQLSVIEGAGHADPRFYQNEISAKVLAFLDRYLKV
ncbi:alpha/beta hydrolase [Lachnoclostridium sp. Marseille-P6806]|uniref:alpha/beta hydrolase n=1 Tax=Lachnoclostridium sp. Marseille-P6806 TaxID=2364793 RepID=UPI001F5FC01E|nr:alpha/beta hydrolase [Lachnoclostridium sp. Marseille-P6806]